MNPSRLPEALVGTCDAKRWSFRKFSVNAGCGRSASSVRRIAQRQTDPRFEVGLAISSTIARLIGLSLCEFFEQLLLPDLSPASPLTPVICGTHWPKTRTGAKSICGWMERQLRCAREILIMHRRFPLLLFPAALQAPWRATAAAAEFLLAAKLHEIISTRLATPAAHASILFPKSEFDVLRRGPDVGWTSDDRHQAIEIFQFDWIAERGLVVGLFEPGALCTDAAELVSEFDSMIAIDRTALFEVPAGSFTWRVFNASDPTRGNYIRRQVDRLRKLRARSSPPS